MFRETFHFSYPGSKQITSHGTSRWFLLAFYTWKTLSAFLQIQVMSKQALASLHISSIILCAASMENKKSQALGNDLNFDLKQTCAEGWKKFMYADYFCICHFPASFFLFSPVLGKGKNRKAKIPRQLPQNILKTADLEGKTGTQHIKSCSSPLDFQYNSAKFRTFTYW